MIIKQWQLGNLRTTFERHYVFCKNYYPCNPFSGQSCDGEHLPESVVLQCKLAELQLSPYDRDLKYWCHRQRGTSFNECMVDRYWLMQYLEECQRQEPEAHEPG